MKVWHDWEFLESGNSIYPIAVGMYTEDDHALYCEFSDAPWDKIRSHDWLMDNVVPLLGSYSYTTVYIKEEVYNFLKDAHDRDPVNGIQLWGWYSSYDHVCLGQLFGAMVNLPNFVPMWTNDLKQKAQELGNPKIPKLRKPTERVHHALDDAIVESRMDQWLENYVNKSNVQVKNSSHVQVGNNNTQVNNFKPTMAFDSEDAEKLSRRKFEDRPDFPGWDAL